MNVLIWGSDTILGHGLLSMLKEMKDGVVLLDDEGDYIWAGIFRYTKED